MLILSRKIGEKVIINPIADKEIVLTILEIQGQRIRLGIDADPTTKIRRAELPPLQKEKQEA